MRKKTPKQQQKLLKPLCLCAEFRRTTVEVSVMNESRGRNFPLSLSRFLPRPPHCPFTITLKTHTRTQWKAQSLTAQLFVRLPALLGRECCDQRIAPLQLVNTGLERQRGAPDALVIPSHLIRLPPGSRQMCVNTTRLQESFKTVMKIAETPGWKRTPKGGNTSRGNNVPTSMTSEFAERPGELTGFKQNSS